MGGFYADSACSIPLAETYDTCGGSGSGVTYALGYLPGTALEDVYSLGSVYAGTVYSGTAASCTALSSTLPYTLYTATELPPSTFAAAAKSAPGRAPATNDLPQNGSRIRYETISTADGLSGPYLALDAQLAQECVFGAAGDGSDRCIPENVDRITLTFFEDPSCSSTPLADSVSVVAPAAYAALYDAQGCNTGTYYTFGPLYEGTVYESVDGACDMSAANSQVSFYPTTPFSSSGFESGTLATGAGAFDGWASGSRIQLVTATGTDGARAMVGWHDAQLGVDCAMTMANDGVMRCVPTILGYISSYYADAACTQALTIAEGCTAPAYAVSTTCGGGYFAVGASYSGPIYVSTSGTCQATTLSLPMYEVGAPVPASTFAEASLSMP